MNERKGFRRFPPKPVNVGDVLDAEIEAVGNQGDGICKKDGFVIFVKGANEIGNKVRVKVVRVGRTSATAELEQ